MSELSEELNEEENTIFGGSEFVFTEKIGGNGKKEIIGGGYKLESSFLEGGNPVMTSYNSKNQNGGKVSSPLESLAVPAGLFYINMRVPKNKNKDKEKKEHYYEEHKTISDDIFDKLFDLVELDKKRKRKTRRNTVSLKHDKIKTRKHK